MSRTQLRRAPVHVITALAAGVAGYTLADMSLRAAIGGAQAGQQQLAAPQEQQEAPPASQLVQRPSTWRT